MNCEQKIVSEIGPRAIILAASQNGAMCPCLAPRILPLIPNIRTPTLINSLRPSDAYIFISKLGQH